MTTYRLTPAAQQNLSEIWDHTEARWHTTQALGYLAEIREAIERIAADPRRGHACDEIRKGYRRYTVGSHLLFSIQTPGGIDIIRILHQRMDPTRHLQ